jgi:hypothetical protein
VSFPVAFSAQTHEVIHIQSQAGSFEQWLDVMDFGCRCGSSFFFAILAKWIPRAMIFAEPPPSRIISPPSRALALAATVTRI